MKHRIVLLVVALSTVYPFCLAAQGPMRVAPSGRAATEVSLTFADTVVARTAGKASIIRIEYGQPHLRGRVLHTETLVPYDKPWRFGANGATTLMTDVDLLVGGQPVPKGTYVLQAMPTRAGWNLLIQKQIEQSATAEAMSYKPENDIARVPLRMSSLATPLESFSVWLIPAAGAGAPKGELRIGWGPVGLATDWSMR